LFFVVSCSVGGLAESPGQLNGTYIATAYDVSGITASGVYTQKHVVAADPNILPIGTIIRVRSAGPYSGEYVVADTGEKIVGRKLDIYLPSPAACKEFGVKPVRVRVISLGQGTHQDAKEALKEVKQQAAPQ
jgi:3D (Asp-Asp-Asp) domain-containing protein